MKDYNIILMINGDNNFVLEKVLIIKNIILFQKCFFIKLEILGKINLSYKIKDNKHINFINFNILLNKTCLFKLKDFFLKDKGIIRHIIKKNKKNNIINIFILKKIFDKFIKKKIYEKKESNINKFFSFKRKKNNIKKGF